MVLNRQISTHNSVTTVFFTFYKSILCTTRKTGATIPMHHVPSSKYLLIYLPKAI